MILKIPANKINPLHADYDAALANYMRMLIDMRGYNPVWKKSIQNSLNWDSTELEIDDTVISLADADTLHDKGCKILNWQLFIEIENTTDTCLLNNTLTWAEWIAPNHTFMVRSNRTFVETNANGGTYLPFDILVLSGVRSDLLTPAEMLGVPPTSGYLPG